jgi:hypothetical protein
MDHAAKRAERETFLWASALADHRHSRGCRGPDAIVVEKK